MPRKVKRYPTTEELNSLPPHIRDYVHDLHTVEIQFQLRQLRELELQREQLIAKIALLKGQLERKKKKARQSSAH